MKDPTIERLEHLLDYKFEQVKGIQEVIYKFQRGSGAMHHPGQDWSKEDNKLPVKVSHQSVIYQFRDDQMLFLNEILTTLEHEIMKLKSSGIILSSAIGTLISKRHEEEDGFMKLAKASANKAIHTGATHDILLGMRTLAELSGAQCQITVAESNVYFFVFLMPEDEAMKMVSSIVVPKKRAAPEKVAVKMILLRIRKIQMEVRKCNDRLTEDLKNTFAAQSAVQVHTNKDYFTSIPPLPLDGGRGVLIEYINTVLANRNRTQYKTQQLQIDTLKLLKREDMTDSVIDEALKIAQVEDVMES